MPKYTKKCHAHSVIGLLEQRNDLLNQILSYINEIMEGKCLKLKKLQTSPNKSEELYWHFKISF